MPCFLPFSLLKPVQRRERFTHVDLPVKCHSHSVFDVALQDTSLDKPAFSGLRRREAKPSGVPVSYDNNDDDDFERELLMGKDISTDRAASETSSGVSSYRCVHLFSMLV